MAVSTRVTKKCLKYRWMNATDLKSCNLITRNILVKNSEKFRHPLSNTLTCTSWTGQRYQEWEVGNRFWTSANYVRGLYGLAHHKLSNTGLTKQCDAVACLVVQTTGWGAFRSGLSGLRGALTHPSVQPSEKWAMWYEDIEEENEEAFCPTVQIKEVIACIASQTGRGTREKTQKSKDSWRWKSKRAYCVRYFHFASANPTSRLEGSLY